jgi:hypothetical protein
MNHLDVKTHFPSFKSLPMTCRDLGKWSIKFVNFDCPALYSPLSVGGEMPFHDSTHHSIFAPDPVFNHYQKKAEMGVWTWVSIVGGTLLAGFIGIVHQLFDEHLDTRLVSGHWT